MSEALRVLLIATVAMSAAVLLLGLLRRPLIQWGGASARYVAWLMVPGVAASSLLALVLPAQVKPWQIELPSEGAAGLSRLSAVLGQPVRLTAEGGSGVAPALLLLWALGAVLLVLFLAAQQRARQGQSGVALVGVLRPHVQLPPHFHRRFSPLQRRLMLLHERVHAERGDTRWLALAWGLLVLQWFNPFAWWAMARLRHDMELACDAEVLRRRPGYLASYRAALLAAGSNGPSAPLATPCSLHPLIERIAMLPSHRTQPTRRFAVLAGVLAVSGLAFAAQPGAKPEPEPAMQEGYSKLRLDLQVSVNGKKQEPTLMLHTFNDTEWLTVNGTNLMVMVSGRPHRDPKIANGEEVLMLNFEVRDASSTQPLAKPRIATKDGVPARIEYGEEGKQVVRIDVLPRIVRTRLHGGPGALAELKREIEIGKAPAISVKP